MNVEDECDMCFEYKRCSSEKCTEHILYDGEILDFARAMRDGRLWGDVIYEEEEEKKAKETNAEKEKRIKKQTDDDKKAMDNLKKTILNKNRIKNCIEIDGKWKLKYKYPSDCENLKLEDTIFPDGSKYPGGCWAHIDGVCPFMHPDEKDKYKFKGKRKIDLINSKHTRSWHGGAKKRCTRKSRK